MDDGDSTGDYCAVCYNRLSGMPMAEAHMDMSFCA